ncbi:DUF3426 domain-containing protein [Acaryochloris thomasi]|nr:DUF3426 domain-containing protein [Acaryochloris thomasi]
MRRTLLLVGFMLTIGAVCGLTGYSMGYQSLRGITQPALNPVLNGGGDSSKRRPQQGASLLSEKEIVAKVKTKTRGAKKPTAQKPKPKPSPQESNKEESDKAKKDSKPQSFPVKTEAKGMNLEVRSLSQDEDGLVLNVALQNNSSKPVQFVYTFLDVVDDQGQALLAEAQGLPADFQANSETFYGTIKILDVSGDNIERVSLTLTDYPDQAIKLEALNIPVLE